VKILSGTLTASNGAIRLAVNASRVLASTPTTVASSTTLAAPNGHTTVSASNALLPQLCKVTAVAPLAVVAVVLIVRQLSTGCARTAKLGMSLTVKTTVWGRWWIIVSKHQTVCA
jgi:hypothetical protein